VTPCGPELECDRASEICVRSDFDTGQTHECVPLPDGCGSMRTCGDCAAVCDEPAESCTETDEDNVVACPCLVCG